MGQFDWVAGRDADTARAALRRVSDARERLGGHGRGEAHEAGATVLVHAPPRHGRETAPVRLPGGGVAAGQGAWLVADRRGADALAALAPPLRTGGAAWGNAAAVVDGAFVLGTADKAGRELVLATDRVGTQHVYLAQHDGTTLVSHSALVLARATGAAIDPLAAREFLGTGSVFEERSLFAGVRKLPAGTWFRIVDGRVAEERRWHDPSASYHGARVRAGDVQSLADALVAALDAVLRRWPDAVLDLTGGFDSRAVVAAALAAGHRPRTVCVGADGDPDVVAAAGIARALDLPHVQLRPGVDYGPRTLDALHDALRLTDGEADVVEYAGIAAIQARMSEQAGEAGATVNGTAGELCRGYWWDLLPSLGAPGAAFDARRAAAGRFVTDGWADAMTVGHRDAPLLEHATAMVERACAGLRELPAVALADHVYLVLRMHRWAGRLASATGRLWPCVSPFLFARPMQAALSAPPALRRRDRMMRALQERLHPELAALPMAGGYPALPLRASTFSRFGPLASELLGKVRRRLVPGSAAAPGGPPGSHATLPDLLADEAVADALRPEAMRTVGLYDEAALRAFLAARDVRGATAARRLSRVLTLELAARALAN